MPETILTDLERRAVANLSIPRNVADLTGMLRADSAVDTPSESSTQTLLLTLAQLGLVASLGSRHESPGLLAAAVDDHPKTVSMPDEKAQTFEQRLLVPDRAWRAEGEQWHMTEEGLAALLNHAGVGNPKPAPLAIVQAAIATEFARVHAGPVGDKTKLGHRLLESEFADWAASVAKAHEEATGERVALPIAGGGGWFDATELLILDPENAKGSAYTEASPWYMAAVTVAVTDADTGSTITEANYTGYARKSVASGDMNSAAAGSAANANAITFAACTAGTSAVIGFAKCVAATVGRGIKYGTCTTVNVSATQTPLSFAAGSFTTTAD